MKRTVYGASEEQQNYKNIEIKNLINYGLNITWNDLSLHDFYYKSFIFIINFLLPLIIFSSARPHSQSQVSIKFLMHYFLQSFYSSLFLSLRCHFQDNLHLNLSKIKIIFASFLYCSVLLSSKIPWLFYLLAWIPYIGHLLSNFMNFLHKESFQASMVKILSKI